MKRADTILTVILVLICLFAAQIQDVTGEAVRGVRARGTPPTTLGCTDTDNGLDYDTRGTVTYIHKVFGITRTKTYTDKCAGRSKNLLEYYCKANKKAVKTYKCPNGCKNGVCLREAVVSPPDEVEEPIIVTEGDYLGVTIEYVDDAPLDDSGYPGMAAAQKAVYIHASGDNRFNLSGGIQTSEIWIPMLDSVNKIGNQEVGIFYRDKDKIPDIIFLEKGIYFYYQINYKDTLLKLSITKVFDPTQNREYFEILIFDGKEIVESHFYLVNDEVKSLGKIISLEEPDELIWKEYRQPKVEIGTRDTDLTMKIGVIIKNPKSNGASDQVVLQIPSSLTLLPTEPTPECTTNYDCSSGYICKDGACIKEEVPTQECSDTDGGMNYYIKGTCKDNGAYPIGATDYCQLREDGKYYLIEMYCHNGRECFSADDYDCPNGCKDGKCIKEEIPILTKPAMCTVGTKVKEGVPSGLFGLRTTWKTYAGIICSLEVENQNYEITCTNQMPFCVMGQFCGPTTIDRGQWVNRIFTGTIPSNEQTIYVYPKTDDTFLCPGATFSTSGGAKIKGVRLKRENNKLELILCPLHCRKCIVDSAGNIIRRSLLGTKYAYKEQSCEVTLS